jgi:hypothetical protein
MTAKPNEVKLMTAKPFFRLTLCAKFDNLICADKTNLDFSSISREK